jgi:hypothetical protein
VIDELFQVEKIRQSDVFFQFVERKLIFSALLQLLRNEIKGKNRRKIAKNLLHGLIITNRAMVLLLARVLVTMKRSLGAKINSQIITNSFLLSYGQIKMY